MQSFHLALLHQLLSSAKKSIFLNYWRKLSKETAESTGFCDFITPRPFGGISPDGDRADGGVLDGMI